MSGHLFVGQYHLSDHKPLLLGDCLRKEFGISYPYKLFTNQVDGGILKVTASLFDNQPLSRPVRPPKPKPFHMTEPAQERGVWNFWLTAEPEVLQFVCHLHCILQQPQNTLFRSRRPQSRMMFSINPRYDPQETWLWICDLLESETQKVELSDIWLNVLESEEEESENEG